jgi:hypothetical protein
MSLLEEQPMDQQGISRVKRPVLDEPSEQFAEKVDRTYAPLVGMDPGHPIGRQFDPVLTPETVALLSDTDKARLEARAATIAKAANAALGAYGSANPHTRNVAVAAARMMAGLEPLPSEALPAETEVLNG